MTSESRPQSQCNEHVLDRMMAHDLSYSFGGLPSSDVRPQGSGSRESVENSGTMLGSDGPGDQHSSSPNSIDLVV